MYYGVSEARVLLGSVVELPAATAMWSGVERYKSTALANSNRTVLLQRQRLSYRYAAACVVVQRVSRVTARALLD